MLLRYRCFDDHIQLVSQSQMFYFIRINHCIMYSVQSSCVWQKMVMVYCTAYGHIRCILYFVMIVECNFIFKKIAVSRKLLFNSMVDKSVI